MEPDDLDAALANIRQGSPAPHADDMDAALSKIRASTPPTGHNGVPFVNPKPDDDPSYASQALGGIASLVRDIPGAEAAQSAVRAVVRRQPYAQARNDIRGAEDSAPPVVRNANRFVGGTIAALATPGASGALQGARYGVLNGLLSSDSNKGVKDRIDDAGVQMAAGAIGGKLADVGTTAVRGVLAKSLGSNALARKAAMSDASKALYGDAATEGASAFGPTPPAVHSALNASDVAPYVKAIRGSREFANADDPTVLREAYKLMSERQQLLKGRINAKDFSAGTDLEHRNIGLAKQELLSAADQVMPSFRPAVAQHAEMAGEREAFREGAGAAGRIARNNTVAPRNLEKNSPEAFAAKITDMNESTAKASREGVLGALKKNQGLVRNTVTGKMNLNVLGPASRLAPYLRALDTQAGGNSIADALRAAGISQLTPSGR